jgi:hypothetical protein
MAFKKGLIILFSLPFRTVKQTLGVLKGASKLNVLLLLLYERPTVK